jgi:hypothetical protein
MENEKIFKTKTGFCHVLPDKIVLTRDGVIGNVSNVVVGKGILRILIMYAGFSIFMFYNAFLAYQKGNIILAILYGAVALFLMYSIAKSVNNSATSVIPRSKIERATFIKGIAGLTRSRFEIMFKDERENLKKRLIMLPGSLQDGKNETEKALEIMKDEKIIGL